MDLESFVDQFRARVLQDALSEATSSYWLRRAEQFEDARPRLSEHHGQQSADQLRARWVELTETATACRAAAALARYQTDVTAEVFDEPREAA